MVVKSKKPTEKKTTTKRTTTKTIKSKADNGGDNDEFLKLIGGDIYKARPTKKEFKFEILKSSTTSLNRATGAGGILTGGIWEISGLEHSGKSALGVMILADAQRQGHLTMFADGERSDNDDRWTRALGWKKEKGLYFRPEYFEHCRVKVNKTINTFLENQRKGKIPKDKKLFILVDSVPTLVPKECLDDDEKEENKSRFGKIAQLMSDWLPVLLTKVGDGDDAPSNVTVMFVNQLRINLGASMFEEKYKTYGGEALRFYAQVRVRVSKSSNTKKKINGNDVIVGKEHKVKFVKCKIGVGEEAKFYTSNGRGDCELGIDNFKEVLTEGIYRKVFEKTGQSIQCDLLNLDWKNEKACRKHFKENPEDFETIVNHLNDTITEFTANKEDDEE